MAISAKEVMELRKQTDCGMMECKKALTDANGDFAKAIELLRERGLATAAKKAGRVAAEGMVYADYCPACKVGVVIEVNAETDFVAKNEKFVEFVKEAAKVIMGEHQGSPFCPLRGPLRSLCARRRHPRCSGQLRDFR